MTYRAELRALARRFEPSAGELRDSSGLLVFDAGELSRQSISLPGKELVQPPSVKDIETINLLHGRKTAASPPHGTSTWLVGTEGIAAMKAQAADGRAVDVRTCKVDYGERRADVAITLLRRVSDRAAAGSESVKIERRPVAPRRPEAALDAPDDLLRVHLALAAAALLLRRLEFASFCGVRVRELRLLRQHITRAAEAHEAA